MLSKIIGSFAVIGFLTFSPTADAHNRHKPRPAVSQSPAVSVTISWSWVEATIFRRGHWVHPHYGRDYSTFKVGPPAVRPHAHATWVPGHYEGRGRHRHWVPGHWRR